MDLLFASSSLPLTTAPASPSWMPLASATSPLGSTVPGHAYRIGWLLPNVDPDTINELRPDILLIQGLSPASYSSKQQLLDAWDCDTLAQYVHDEVDSTSDVSYDDSLNRKRTQHALRIRLLLACSSWL